MQSSDIRCVPPRRPGVSDRSRSVRYSARSTRMAASWSLELGRCPNQQRTFQALSRPWVVERTCGWLNLQRRFSKDCEALCESTEAWLYIPMTGFMLRRWVHFGHFGTPSYLDFVHLADATDEIAELNAFWWRVFQCWRAETTLKNFWSSVATRHGGFRPQTQTWYQVELTGDRTKFVFHAPLITLRSLEETV